MAQNILSSARSWVPIILFPLFLLSMCALLIAFDPLLYDNEFSKLGVYGMFGKENVNALHKEVLSYLSGESETLGTNFFNAREKAHLADVLWIFHSVRIFALVSGTSIILMLALSKEKIILVKDIFLKGSILLLAVMGLLLLALFFNFTGAFSSFHQVFFPQGNYLFDPATENMVNLYPEALFAHLAGKIALFSVILSLIFLFTGLCLDKHIGGKNGKHKQKGI